MTPRALLKKLPGSIKVGPHDVVIRVLSRTPRNKLLGYFDQCRGKLRITLASDLDTTSCVVDTFCHEVIHAAYFVGSLGEREPEEKVAGTLATGFVQVLQDNRWLLSWLRAGTKK